MSESNPAVVAPDGSQMVDASGNAMRDADGNAMLVGMMYDADRKLMLNPDGSPRHIVEFDNVPAPVPGSVDAVAAEHAHGVHGDHVDPMDPMHPMAYGEQDPQLKSKVRPKRSGPAVEASDASQMPAAGKRRVPAGAPTGAVVALAQDVDEPGLDADGNPLIEGMVYDAAGKMAFHGDGKPMRALDTNPPQTTARPVPAADRKEALRAAGGKKLKPAPQMYVEDEEGYDDEAEAEAAAANEPVALTDEEAHEQGLVAMARGSDRVHVHPTTIQSHMEAGWKPVPMDKHDENAAYKPGPAKEV